MVITPNEHLLREYWDECGEESEYHVQIGKLPDFTPLVTTKQGSRIVGVIQRKKDGGALVLLPWLNLKRNEFYSEASLHVNGPAKHKWSAEGQRWGRRFYQALVSLDSAIKGERERTPVPSWAQSEAYVTAQEKMLSEELSNIESDIDDLGKKHEYTKDKLNDAGLLRALLYETGHPLNDAVLEAMSLMGFKADNFRESDSEYDAVLENPEGRCIGEVVGRDNGAINNKKMAQLMNNVNEDLLREEVTEPAKSVLFGNGYRLKPPPERPFEQLTTKCMKMAAMYRTALVRTCDLFEVAKALTDNPDPNFAAKCKKVILETEGKVVVFPVPLKRSPSLATRSLEKSCSHTLDFQSQLFLTHPFGGK